MVDLYEEFSRRLLNLNELIIIDKSCDNELGVTNSEKLELVRVIRETLSILPVSYYEEYLMSLIREFIEQLNSSQPQTQWEKLPENIRKTHLFDSDFKFSKKNIDKTSFSDYESKIFSDLKKLADVVLSPLSQDQFYTINVDPFIKTNSNPDSKTTNEIFNRIGLDNIFNNSKLIEMMSEFDEKFNEREVIRRELDTIVTHRHIIAHGGSTIMKTREELDSNIKFIIQLGKSLASVCKGQALNIIYSGY